MPFGVPVGNTKEERTQSMNQQDLRSLSRGELLEIMVQQAEELEALRKENEEYRQRLQELPLTLDEPGSIAEAALKVSGIFEAAHQASARYLESIEVLASQKEQDALRTRQLLEETEAKCAAMWEETQKQCKKMVEKAKRDSMDYWVKVSKKVDKNL
jgi:hypothetical protein